MLDRIKKSLPGAFGGAIGIALVLGAKGTYQGLELFLFCALEFIILFLGFFLLACRDKEKKP